MSNSSPATEILEIARPDLVANWFGRIASLGCHARDRAQILAYGGVSDAASPQDLVAGIDRLRGQVRFNLLLAELMAKKCDSSWPANVANRQRQHIQEMLESLGASAIETDELHAFVLRLQEQSRDFQSVAERT